MIQGSIPQKDIQQWNSLMDDLQRVTHKSQQKIVFEAAVGYCQGGRNESPKSKKRRKLEKNPGRQKVDGQWVGAKRRYKVYTQTKEWWEYTDERSAKAVGEGTLIKHQGALQNSWRGLIGDLYKKPSRLIGNSADNNPRKILKAVKGTIKDSTGGRTITLENSISYLFNVTPQVDAKALNKAYKIMNVKLERKVMKDWRKQWET